MIEVGDYVRCKNGKIAKVESIDKNFIYFDAEIYRQNGIAMHECETCFSEFIIKHSKNIIDIIEVGDYVNGSKLLSIDYAEDKFGNCDKLHFYYSFEDDEKDVNEYYESLKIKSIVTKEQFANMEYRLED